MSVIAYGGAMASRSFPTRGIAAIWGALPGGKRGPTPGLRLTEILDAAVALADEGGIRRVTLPSLAARLGVATSSLYRYLDSKDELVLLLLDAGLSDPPTGLPSGKQWRAGARRWLETLLEAYASRPWLLDVPLRHGPITPRTLGWLESLLVVLDGSEWDDGAALQLATVLDQLARSLARLRVGVLDDASAPGTPEEVTTFLGEHAGAAGFAQVQRLVDRAVWGSSIGVFDLDLALDWVFASVRPGAGD